MKYISIDLETSGLDPETYQILSFGAIIEDTNNPLTFEEVPKFYRVIKHKQIVGEPYALNMNRELIKEISENGNGLTTEEGLVEHFHYFLIRNNIENKESIYQLKVAGKNFGTFDKLFLEKLPGWPMYFKIHQRILDPGNLHVDFYNDDWIPNLDTCLERAGVDRKVSHNALEDAWDTILALRAKYNG